MRLVEVAEVLGDHPAEAEQGRVLADHRLGPQSALQGGLPGARVGRHQGQEDHQLQTEQVSRETVVVALPRRERRPHALAGQGDRRLDERALPVVRRGPAAGGRDLGLDVERLPRERRQQRGGRPRDGEPGVGGDHRAQRVGGARAAGAVPVQEHLPQRGGVGIGRQGHPGRHRRFNASHPARSWTAIPAYADEPASAPSTAARAAASCGWVNPWNVCLRETGSGPR